MAVPNLWRNKKQRYSLLGEVCVNCASAVFPPREICPHCHKSTQVVAASVKPTLTFGTLSPVMPVRQVALVGDD